MVPQTPSNNSGMELFVMQLLWLLQPRPTFLEVAWRVCQRLLQTRLASQIWEKNLYNAITRDPPTLPEPCCSRIVWASSSLSSIWVSDTEGPNNMTHARPGPFPLEVETTPIAARHCEA